MLLLIYLISTDFVFPRKLGPCAWLSHSAREVNSESKTAEDEAGYTPADWAKQEGLEQLRHVLLERSGGERMPAWIVDIG